MCGGLFWESLIVSCLVTEISPSLINGRVWIWLQHSGHSWSLLYTGCICIVFYICRGVFSIWIHCSFLPPFFFPQPSICISTCGITLNFLQNDSSKFIQFIQATYAHSTFLFFLLFMTSVGDGRWYRNTEEISTDIKSSFKKSKKRFLYIWRFPWLRKAMK